MFNKKILQYIPLNIFLCAGSWAVPFLLLSLFLKTDPAIAAIFSMYFYLNNLIRTSELDYLNDRLNKLEMVIVDKPAEVKNEYRTRKCVIARYDETITEPPFETIVIDTVEVLQPTNDYLGEDFYNVLQQACSNKGHKFKYYSLTRKEGFDYEIVVE